MSSTLTENVVLVRTRSHDLNSVKKLNCWGCTLKDVSIVNRMPNVEVISLSINSIDTLQYFAACSMLQELYLRKNEIKNLNEILHLSQLPFLKKLSLEDNPCANVDNYRLTVLKALPNLEFLDNVKVTAEELYQAEKLGRDLAWPGTEVEEMEEPVEVINEEYSYSNASVNLAYEPQNTSQSINKTSTATSGQAPPPQQQQPQLTSMAQEYAYNGSTSSENTTTSNGYAYSYNGNGNTPRNSNNNSQQSSQQQTQSSPYAATNNTSAISNGNNNNSSRDSCGSNGSASKKTNMAKANSLSDYNIYSTNGNFRCSSPALSGANTFEPMINEYYENGQTNTGQSYYMPNTNNNSYRSNNSSRANVQSANSQRILPKGGKNRNANILSAVLCLIKELDYGSLEVVDTTIHCRMEEMED